ncbi:acyltransferase family protein [Spirillospora sp. CA-294931]|uniref:acyltransferase family protein n=1 Tax=Spirillospora sp. CA-294931 TaxID=3240042 RepID=UPI003D93CAB4
MSISPNGQVRHPPEGTTQGGRMRALEGYRGLAAISTVLFHVWQHYTLYGPEGARPPVTDPVLKALLSFEVVDLFFVLSAYLLTLSYARTAIDRKPGHTARSFLYRRAVRILPLYWFAILVVWSSRNQELPGDWIDLVEHLTFVQVFDEKRIFYTIGPAWSMSLEIMFYGALVVLGPLAARACAPIESRRDRAALCAAGCLAIFAVPVAWLAFARYGLHVPHTEWASYYGPQARFHAFGAGMFLAVLTVALSKRARLAKNPATALRVAAPSALVVLTWLADDPESAFAVFYHPICAVLWTVMLYATVHARSESLWHRALSARWITGIGLVSYSLYLWHEPIMIMLDRSGFLPAYQSGFPLAVLVVLAVSLPLAAASYWLIEYPTALLRRLKTQSHRPREYYPYLSR